MVSQPVVFQSTREVLCKSLGDDLTSSSRPVRRHRRCLVGFGRERFLTEQPAGEVTGRPTADSLHFQVVLPGSWE